MNQKEQSLITLKALIKDSEGDSIRKEYLIEKIDACLELAKPSILLNEESKRIFEGIVEDLKGRGKIV